MGHWAINPDDYSQYSWVEDLGDDPNNPSSPNTPPPNVQANLSDPNAQNLGGWSQQALDWYASQGQTPAGGDAGFIQHSDPTKGDFFSQFPSKDDGGGGWIRQHGWAVPLAAAAAFGGVAAMGAGAAEGGGAIGSTVGTEGATGIGGVGGSTASTLPSLSWTAPEIGGSATGSTFGSLNAALPATGSVGGAGAGMSAALPAGTMIGDGTLGTTMGASYMASAPGQFALDATGSAIPASSVGIGGYAPTSGISASDALNTAKNVKNATSTANNLAKMLSQGAGSGLSSSLGKLAAGQTPSQSNLPALVRGNQNPFAYTAQSPIQTAQPMYISSLANLLKQG